MADPTGLTRPVATVRHVEHVMGMAVSIHVRDQIEPTLLEPALAHSMT